MTGHFLVIGAQRCGTTYLHELLAAHPEIAMARPARPEPKVFLSEELTGRGYDWYRNTYFGHAGDAKLLGEKGTSYIESAVAPGRAAAVLGAPRIVVQLRDPVSRAVSNWRFSTFHGVEDRPLARALTENLRGPRDWDPAATSVSPYAYLERGHYVAYLQPWLEAFPGRVRVQLMEDLVREPDLIGELYDWLGVDPTVRPDALGHPVNRSESPAPDLDEALVAQLRDHFAASDRALAQLLGRALPWPSRSDEEAAG